MTIPVFDNHVHLQRSGRFIDAAMEFKHKGGSAMLLVNLPPEGDPCSEEFFDRMYSEAESIRDEVAMRTGLTVLLAVGPYPVTLLEMAGKEGLRNAEERMIAAVDLAAAHVKENRADAIGEVGRPHFPVPAEITESSNRIMHECMQRAKEASCAVVLHTEDPSRAMMTGLAEMAVSAGIEKGRVVKHHCTDLIGEEENGGLFPSVKATRELVQSSARKGSRFMMETDYIDDPLRPGAVLGIGTVPRRTRELVESGLFADDIAWRIHEDNPASVYGSDRITARSHGR